MRKFESLDLLSASTKDFARSEISIGDGAATDGLDEGALERSEPRRRFRIKLRKGAVVCRRSFEVRDDCGVGGRGSSEGRTVFDRPRAASFVMGDIFHLEKKP